MTLCPHWLSSNEGEGGDWHDAWIYCCLKLATPVGLSPSTLVLSLNPLPSEGGGAHQPLTTLCH